jgi:hypothetical protein
MCGCFLDALALGWKFGSLLVEFGGMWLDVNWRLGLQPNIFDKNNNTSA